MGDLVIVFYWVDGLYYGILINECVSGFDFDFIWMVVCWVCVVVGVSKVELVCGVLVGGFVIDLIIDFGLVCLLFLGR